MTTAWARLGRTTKIILFSLMEPLLQENRTVELFKIAGGIAGLGGLSIALVFFLYRDIIAKNIFPQLSKEHAYKIIRLIIISLFVLACVGIFSYVYLSITQADEKRTISLTIIDSKDRIVNNAIIDTVVGTSKQLARGTWEINVRKSEEPRDGVLKLSIIQDSKLIKVVPIDLLHCGQIVQRTIKLDDTKSHNLRGLVREQLTDERVAEPIRNATVEIQDSKTGVRTISTDDTGYFSADLSDEEGAKVRVIVRKAGFVPFDDYLTVGSNALTVTMSKDKLNPTSSVHK